MKGFRLLGRRLGSNLSAQLYSQIVTIGVQLGTVPLLIAAWGIDRYGVWLLLTAIPAYLAFSDFGFTFIAKNDMAMRVSGGDRNGALETFQSILVLLIGASIAVSLAAAGLLSFAPLGDWFNLGTEQLSDVQLVLAAQVASALVYQVTLLCFAGVRCEGRPATETFMAASSRMFEALVIVGAAFSGAGIAVAALCALAARVLTLLGLAIWLHRTTPWLNIGFRHATRARLKSLAGPSFTYMLVPLSNAALIQGPILVLGVVATPAAVVLFSVTRTVARLGMSGANMLNFTFTPEYSFAYGRGDRPAFERLLKIHAILMLAGIVAYLMCVVFLGDLGVHLISHGQLKAIPALTMVLGLGVVFEMIWSGLFSPLSAINAHKTASIALAMIAATAAVVTVPHATVMILAGALACVHAGMILVASHRMTRFKWPT